jgi:hypothetical protein
MDIRKTIRNYKPIFSSERMFHKGYDPKGSVESKKSLVVSLKGFGAKTK